MVDGVSGRSAHSQKLGLRCELYPLLKRPDEKFVTEKAYDNPRFVEDLSRELTLRLRADSRIRWFSVEVENFESIHAHNAFAAIEEWCVDRTDEGTNEAPSG